MSDAEQRAHDLTCAMLSNSQLTESFARELKKPDNNEVIFDIDLMYDKLYEKCLKHFMKSK